ncbi:YczI family protein [Lentibacillus sediminis]|uniref:YczI family protein n=1 Tax=Lentibacillus sediminis TaxID=1940529 RepID=UPI00117B212B|nr:YczI family protein [Lentibacillus sediminis]
MLNIIRIITAVIAGSLAIYALITGNHHVMPYMMFFMGVMLLAMGLSEIKKERRRMGFLSIIVSLFVFYVSVQGFLFNFSS